MFNAFSMAAKLARDWNRRRRERRLNRLALEYLDSQFRPEVYRGRWM